MAYRVTNPLGTNFDQTGRVAAMGSIQYFEAGTSTPKAVYEDPDLVISNGSTVDLDASGRQDVDSWGSGDYRVRLRDRFGALIYELDNVRDPAASTGAAIPTLVPGSFLTNDGALLQWLALLLIPDPTGSDNKVLGTDGTNLNWVSQTAIPTPPAPDIVVTADSFQAGISSDNTKFFLLRGTGSAPATGTKGTSTNIAFATPFDALWHVSVTTTIAAATPSGALVDNSVTGFTPGNASSGVTVNFNVSDDDGNAAWKISNAIDFTWVAIGTREVAPPSP